MRSGFSRRAFLGTAGALATLSPSYAGDTGLPSFDLSKPIKKWVTPGWGYYGAVTADKGSPSGGHDVKWAGNGRYWMAVPASGRIFLIQGETGAIVRSIPAPVLRTHGLAIDGNYLWSVA